MTTASLKRRAKFIGKKFDEAANDPAICKACEIVQMTILATLPILTPFLIMHWQFNNFGY
jgi:hypothetical protein